MLWKEQRPRPQVVELFSLQYLQAGHSTQQQNSVIEVNACQAAPIQMTFSTVAH
jgi:hypothetical protein